MKNKNEKPLRQNKEMRNYKVKVSGKKWIELVLVVMVSEHVLFLVKMIEARKQSFKAMNHLAPKVFGKGILKLKVRIVGAT